MLRWAWPRTCDVDVHVAVDVILVNVGAVLAIVWIVWYFWLSEKR